MNRLAGASSPYLRQHATNPVHWYPWGEEALGHARERGCPILLSIGYSACHWCHVMERESFADPETARLMNREFVSVKVDREERPDLDTVYMRAVQALTGHGGWPLTVFLTPEGEPFFGGTYYPPERRHGMPAFREVLAGAAEAWKRRRGDVLGAAARIRGFLVATNVSADGKPPPEAGPPDPDLPARASRRLLAAVDPVHGGIGRAPKFPQPEVLGFLLDRHALAGEEDALAATLLTLRAMARGGIRDQLGGGFHRYSVDERWLVPHFEKMLYDNALLAQVYLRAFQLTGEKWLEEVCRGILDDLLDDFRSPEGVFYTARDADSEGEEGRFYLWTPAEVAALLPEAEARLFSRCYDVSEEGNFEGRNILHLPHDLAGVARSEGITPDALEARLRASSAVLKQARTKREAPFRDEKILASWNALVIRALAETGAALGEERYVRAAEHAAASLLAGLTAVGALRHQISDGKAEVPGFPRRRGRTGERAPLGPRGDARRTLARGCGPPGPRGRGALPGQRDGPPPRHALRRGGASHPPSRSHRQPRPLGGGARRGAPNAPRPAPRGPRADPGRRGDRSARGARDGGRPVRLRTPSLGCRAARGPTHRDRRDRAAWRQRRRRSPPGGAPAVPADAGRHRPRSRASGRATPTNRSRKPRFSRGVGPSTADPPASSA